jgi:hypothetical protein
MKHASLSDLWAPRQTQLPVSQSDPFSTRAVMQRACRVILTSIGSFGPYGESHLKAGYKFSITRFSAHFGLCDAMLLIVRRKCRPHFLQFLSIGLLPTHAPIKCDGRFTSGQRISSLTSNSAAELPHIEVWNLIRASWQDRAKDCWKNSNDYQIKTHRNHLWHIADVVRTRRPTAIEAQRAGRQHHCDRGLTLQWKANSMFRSPSPGSSQGRSL